jgi:hypothetical protein
MTYIIRKPNHHFSFFWAAGSTAYFRCFVNGEPRFVSSIGTAKQFPSREMANEALKAFNEECSPEYMSKVVLYPRRKESSLNRKEKFSPTAPKQNSNSRVCY